MWRFPTPGQSAPNGPNKQSVAVPFGKFLREYPVPEQRMQVTVHLRPNESLMDRRAVHHAGIPEPGQQPFEM